MNFEDQLLIGGLLMAIALFCATHAHARPHPVTVPMVRITLAGPGPGAR